MIRERNEQVELVVRRHTTAERLVDGDHSDKIACRVTHRNKQRVLRIPRVGVRLPLARRRVARAERVQSTEPFGT